jgi:hypothetical protein
MSPNSTLIVGPRVLRDDHEFRQFQALREASFTPWNFPPTSARSPLFGRDALNAMAAAFPEFYLEGRQSDGRLAAFLSTLPAWWGGAPEALLDLDHHQDTLRPGNRRMRLLSATTAVSRHLPIVRPLAGRLTRGWRQDRLRGCNTIVLAAIIIDPSVRGQQIPVQMFAGIRRSATVLGFRHIISPFRPSAYGDYKAARAATHSPSLFREYCETRTAEGLPIDPWLRALVRNGVHLLHPEPRSLRQTGTLEAFDRLRATFRPDRWYSPATDVWECGLTPTWYVDQARREVTSTEPNYWGVLPLAVEERGPVASTTGHGTATVCREASEAA